MAAAIKFLFVVAVAVVALSAYSEMAAAQNCSAGLGQLTVCAPYVVPGMTNSPPSQECCTALQGIDTTCLCNTIDIINQLPATCKLTPVTCGTSA